MNSRDKGKRGEREFAALLRENGFEARRGQQFCGGADSADVMSPALPWLHMEVKRVQNLNLADACAQAERDSKIATSTPHPWRFSTELVRRTSTGLRPPSPQSGEGPLSPVEAERDGNSGGKPWIVAHRRNHAPWLITMRAEFFFELVREFEPQKSAEGTNRTDGTQGTNSTPHPGPVTHSRPLVRPDGPSPVRIPPAASQAAVVLGRGGEGGGAQGTARKGEPEGKVPGGTPATPRETRGLHNNFPA